MGPMVVGLEIVGPQPAADGALNMFKTSSPRAKRAARQLARRAAASGCGQLAEATSCVERPKHQPEGVLGLLLQTLRTPNGATLGELSAATGWQPHSVRGAIAGTLKKRGYIVKSQKEDGGIRTYHLIAEGQS